MRLLRAIAVLVAMLLPGLSHAFSLEDLELGTPASVVRTKLAQAGLSTSQAGSDASVLFVDAAVPGQLTFCREHLGTVSAPLTGGIQGFIDRARQESLQRGGAKVDLAILPGGAELVTSQWDLDRGATLYIVWRADETGAFGSMIRSAPCSVADTSFAAASSSADPNQDRPAAMGAMKGSTPAATPASAEQQLATLPLPAPPDTLVILEGQPTGATSGSAPAEDVGTLVVRLPDAPAGLIVDHEIGGEPSVSFAEPAPQPRARPRTFEVAKPVQNLVQKRVQARSETSAIVPRSMPLVITPPGHNDPEETNSTAPADALPGQTVAGSPGSTETGEASAAAETADDAPAPNERDPRARVRRVKSGRALTAEDCGRLFKSYDRATATYRSLSGATVSCP
ncbi:MAG: hypothetical protein U1E62_01255 [Alsobacter sp.]